MGGTEASRYVHILATRMGIGVYDEAWYEYRLRLFETVTVPSMVAQTRQDFDWLVVVDAQMPSLARKRLDHALVGVPNASVLEVEFKSDFKQTIVEWGKRRAAAVGCDYILSSRLDDDDALRVDFFERLRDEAATFLRAESTPARRAVFSFTLGAMWLPSHRLAYTRYHDSHSLGLSVMEPVGDHKSVYHWTHTVIKQALAPQGAYIRGVDGDDVRWWLYAAHPLAVTDRGDGTRFKKVMEHGYRYDVDDSMLRDFGVNMNAIGSLGTEPVPHQATAPEPLSQRAKEIERQIKSLRQEQAGAGMFRRRSLERKIAGLQAERRSAGSNVVHRP